ncbi:MAG: hypothetical protein H6558_19375 [Lewinellaceae bacterium]|nr:hypothetical protein [Lewinellaceae bacterium]MCB9289160.1 hypothetical protein [Lewinellaceae bacterium]
MPKVWFRVALLNFLIAAIMGVILRYAFVEELPWLKFRFFLHGHSHVAMLGWVYLALYALLMGAFLPEAQQQAPFYRSVFLVSQFAVIGMLITFPIQGYAPLPIAFSTLHGLASYCFTWRFWKDTRRQRGLPLQFVKAALLFMLFSTLALWAMPPIVLLGYQHKAIYYMTVQFYLHFQFNGWFAFAVLGLFFQLLGSRNIHISLRLARPFFRLLAVSAFFTYALAVAWAEPLPIVFAANSLGVTLQLAAMVLFALLVAGSHRELHQQLGGWGFLLIKIAFACFALKVLMQAAVVIPYIATVAYTIRNFVIGFIHLVLLGVITQFILGYAALNGVLNLRSRLSRLGLGLLLAGFLGSELLLFLQGAMFWGAMGFLPFYYEALFGVSTLMPVGVGVLVVRNRITV